MPRVTPAKVRGGLAVAGSVAVLWAARRGSRVLVAPRRGSA